MALFRDEDLETLKQLGLTLLQAKTYLALCVSGEATMSSISKTSNIARQDVYRVVPALQKLGLVEKILDTPATFRALPVRDGLQLLLQHRKDDFAALQKKASAFIENIQKKNAFKPVGDEDDAQFAIIYDETLLFQKYEKHNALAHKSIDVSDVWPDMKWLISLCNGKDDLFTLAMRKGVKIRLLTEDRGKDFEVDENIVDMSRNSLFEVRFLPPPMPLKLVLYDANEVYTSISLSSETYLPMLWSNNQKFAKIMATQFEELWIKAAKFNAKHQTVRAKATS